MAEEEISDLNLSLSEIRAAPNYLQEIAGIDIFCTLAETKGLVKGSFRSRKYDTSLISKSLGGGGHKQASAVYFEGDFLEEAEKKILEAVKNIGFQKIE